MALFTDPWRAAAPDLGDALLTFLTTMPAGEEAPRDDDIAEILQVVRAYLPVSCLPATVLIQLVLTSPDDYQHARLTALQFLGERRYASALSVAEIVAGIAAAEQQRDTDRVGRWHALLQSYGLAIPFAELVTSVLTSTQPDLRATLITAIDLRSFAFLNPQATPYPDVTRAAVSRFVRRMEKRLLLASERLQLVDLWRNLQQGYALLRYLDDPDARVRSHALRILLLDFPALVSTERLRVFVSDSQHDDADRQRAATVVVQRGAIADRGVPVTTGAGTQG